MTLAPARLNKDTKQVELVVSISPAVTASEISLLLVAEDADRKIVLAESSAILLKIGAKIGSQ